MQVSRWSVDSRCVQLNTCTVWQCIVKVFVHCMVYEHVQLGSGLTLTFNASVEPVESAMCRLHVTIYLQQTVAKEKDVMHVN